MQNADSARDAHRLSADSLLQTLVFFCLIILGAVVECWKLSSLRDPEIWGHIRTGMWILQNKAWPESGIFSQSANLPWRDFSWGFDTIAAIAYRFAGYAAVAALLIIFRLAYALVTFLLAGGWRNFWPAVALSAVAQSVLLAMGPTPTFVSAILFAGEARILWESRESGDVRHLVALPFLFLVWANLDGGFVYGIALYLLYLVASFLESRSSLWTWFERPLAAVRFSHALSIGGCCVMATFLNPYGFHAYTTFLLNELSPVNKNFPGYSAMGFREPADYALTLLGMAAYLALGLVRSRDLFQLGTLVGCTALAFHARREGWLLALAAIAVIGYVSRQKQAAHLPLPFRQWSSQRLGILAAAVALPLAVFFLGKGGNKDLLLTQMKEHFPVGAANFLRQHPQPAPFFNDYRWGAFLTWYLPEYPVAIDSRRGLYPEEMELGYFKAMNADIPYREFPPMSQAHTFLMDKVGVMGQALRGVMGFRVIYEDNVAIVYSHEIKEQP